MIRLCVVAEGFTELDFVKRTLGPHLDARNVFTTTFTVGGAHWGGWKQALRRQSLDKSADFRFTTLVDLYGLPKDFPRLGQLEKQRDTVRRAADLEGAMAGEVGDHRFIPYVQRHEFEALVLSDLRKLILLIDLEEEVRALETLRKQLKGTPPEDVNDGKTTAPSKRLLAAAPSYQKTVHGPLVAGDVGIPELKKRCPRFGQWVSRLEALAPP